jgi:hypothetical protein
MLAAVALIDVLEDPLPLTCAMSGRYRAASTLLTHEALEEGFIFADRPR